MLDTVILGVCVSVLNGWAQPGNYWFVMPPRPGYPGPHILYMSSGKAFEGSSHDEAILKGAKYLNPMIDAELPS